MSNYLSQVISDGYNALLLMISPTNPIQPIIPGNNVIFGTEHFPQDIFNEVLAKSQSDLVVLACINKRFCAQVITYSEKMVPECAFGAKEWKSFGVDPGAVSPIPLKMIQDFDPLKWMLTFIPEKINGEPLTYSSIERFFSEKKNGKDIFKGNFNEPLSLNDLCDKKLEIQTSYWVMLSKDVLDETIGECFATQKQQIKNSGFEVPILIDVVVSLFMHHLRTGEFMYSDGITGDKCSHTRVKQTDQDGFRIVVGGFSRSGLEIFSSIDSGFESIGASYSRKPKFDH